MKARLPAHALYSGQALVEGLVALSVLLLLWVAIGWLARWQDVALQASNASRFAAFSLTRNPAAQPLAQSRLHFFSGSSHQWNDRRGRPLLSQDRAEVSFDLRRVPTLAAHAQPGGELAYAQSLRLDWPIEDTGVASAYISVLPATLAAWIQPEKQGWPANFTDFDRPGPALVRHVSILTGAGHASDDADTQQQVAASAVGWSDAAARSYELGRQVARPMQKVDQGWGRPAPRFDWLAPWAGRVPSHHLVLYEEAGK